MSNEALPSYYFKTVELFSESLNIALNTGKPILEIFEGRVNEFYKETIRKLNSYKKQILTLKKDYEKAKQNPIKYHQEQLAANTVALDKFIEEAETNLKNRIAIEETLSKYPKLNELFKTRTVLFITSETLKNNINQQKKIKENFVDITKVTEEQRKQIVKEMLNSISEKIKDIEDVAQSLIEVHDKVMAEYSILLSQ